MPQRRVLTTSQPQHPAQIDWSNPIARGLLFAITPYQYESVLPAKSRVIPQATKAVPGGIGMTSQRLDAVSGTSAVEAYSTANPNHTVLYFGGPNLENGNVNLVTSQSPSSNAGDIGFNYALGPGLRFIYVNAANTGTGTAGLTVSATDKPRVIVGRTSATSIEIWLDGSLAQTTTGISLYAGAGNITSRQWRNNNFPGLLAIRWSRALTDAEIRSISANPWQVFL